MVLDTAKAPRTILTAGEWLESSYLARVAARVGAQFGLKPEDLPDLVQEVRIALWKIGSESPINITWIFRTAQHKAADFWRRSKRMREGGFPAGDWRHAAEDPELLHLLRARASILPTSLRAFYALRYEEGRSEREIAARLGLCRGSVRWMELQCREWFQGHRPLRVSTPPALARPA